jgi:8-oxo-dGTP pyrophosphatase MutT (NUDIX family)
MRAAVLVPLWADGDDLRLVLTRRPDDMRTHAGDVVFPGGIIESGDDGPIETALREAWEEVGIPREAVTVLGGLRPISTRSREMLMVPVVARIRRPKHLVPEPGEVDAIIEPAITELLDDDRWKSRMWRGHRLWFFEFPQGMLWGATAFIVRDLLEHFRAGAR